LASLGGRAVLLDIVPDSELLFNVVKYFALCGRLCNILKYCAVFSTAYSHSAFGRSVQFVGIAVPFGSVKGRIVQGAAEAWKESVGLGFFESSKFEHPAFSFLFFMV
jgi:hypothetical protein